MTITEFLEARIAEDEAAAGSGWSRLGDTRWESTNEGRSILTPSAVLAECAAKRAIIAAQFDYLEIIDGEWACCHDADVIRRGECAVNPPDKLYESAPIIRALAAVYAGHPDYDKEWAL